MLFGDGSGALCKILSKVGDAVYEVDKCKEYFAGMYVDVGATGSGLTGLYIVAVDVKNSTVTFSSKVTATVTGAKIYPHGSMDNELTGLGAIFDADTLYGYSKAEEPYFKPYAVDGEGELTEEKLTDIIDYAEENFNSKINMIICSYKTRKKIAALIANEKAGRQLYGRAHGLRRCYGQQRARLRRQVLPRRQGAFSEHRRFLPFAALRLGVARRRGRQNFEAGAR